jgi:hypothetical protein
MIAGLTTKEAYRYQRHQPEKTLLYRTIETYWPHFIVEQAKVGKKLPLFIHQEFDDYLKCGIPEFGFVRTYCYQCQYSGLVAFSCKRRGFCPSCSGRRMNDEANHIIKNVIPEITTRQWVLSFPYKIRYVLSHNQKLTNELLKIFIRTIEANQKRRAGNKNSKIGAITFIQRFGSALNLNVHFHTLMTDGVYIPQKDQTYVFQRLPQPTHEELQILANKIKIKIERKLQKLNPAQDNQLPFEEESLSDIAQLSINQRAAFGERAVQKLRPYGINLNVEPLKSPDPTTANNSGYSLNARVWIAYNKRKKLEQVIRYMARGPIAQDRMTETYNNQILYKLKTPWKNGITHFSYSGLDFIARLVALIPPPKMNMIRYHGVFAPNFKHRNKIVPVKKVVNEKNTESKSNNTSNSKVKTERLRWAEMLKKTFEIDVTICPKCNGRLEQIAVIKCQKVAMAILKSLNQNTEPLPAGAPPTGPPEQLTYENEIDQRSVDW